ncbi:MAG: MATE family efflux transporter [Oscillospiraceae bacterium]|jgi:putative MATE family efflux protein|nr:MATE family efflux transporter [Oscillospiraceae bacterium]
MSRPADSKYNLTTGGILKKLLVIAVPVMGTQLLQMSYNLTDMFWLGRLSTAAVAASGTCGLYLWLGMALMMFGRMGAEIGVSQNLGRGDKETARLYGENAFMLSVALGLLYGFIMLALRRPLVGFFQIQEADVVSSAESYLAIVSFGIPFTYAASALVGSFNASGNSRTPFYVNAVGLGINMLLDPLMIFGFHMGIQGAAYATLISQIASFALTALAVARDANRPFERFHFVIKPDRRALAQIIRWSAPISGESAFFASMTMVTSRLISPFGQTALAVGRVGSQIESLTWLIAGGYGSALTAFIGQNYGARKWARIRRGFVISLTVLGVWGALTVLLMNTLGGQLYWLFLPDADVRALGVVYLRILSFCQIPQCLEAAAGGTFKGCGRTAPPSVVSIVSNLLRVLLAWWFVHIWGALGVWAAISLTASLRGATTTIWYMLASKAQPRSDEERDAPDDSALELAQ